MNELIEAGLAYFAGCASCEERFDAMAARWCSCLTPLRTLECSNCGHCFCRAPLPYKRRFWSDAPRQLSQDPRRFYVQLIGSAAVSGPARVSYAKRPPVVMVVDDDESMKSLVACYVDQLGYRTVAASGSEEALELLGACRVDVVITDALMPKMDGRELCRRIKSSYDVAWTKVIVMSSLYKSRASQTEAIHRFGADAMIQKPVDLNALGALLGRLAPIEHEVLA